ncbi:MAG: 2-oxo acid dehydrogenase subunit E2, partial [Planctomycetes bacterium]|nr:2-oxo acid dehydrogenase subunit E2 [Planctomycetota bacterium]
EVLGELVLPVDERSLSETAVIVWKSLLEGTLGSSAFERDRRRVHRLPALAFHAFVRCYGWLDRMFPLPTFGRLDRLRAGAVLVNDLSFRGAPPMRCYKPTKFPDESAALNVTLGPMEERAVVRSGQIVASTVAPLFVRADHRITDAYGLGRFLATLRELLENPARMESCVDTTSGDEERHRSNAA